MDVTDFMSTGSWYKPAEHSQDEKVVIENVEAGTDFNNNKCLNIEITGERKIQLKKRNVKEIAEILGSDASAWIGKEVGLELTEVEYEDKKYPSFAFVNTDDLPF